MPKADRVSPTNKHVDQSFMYRGGSGNKWGSDTSTSSFDVLADLGAINAQLVAATMAGAPPQLGAEPGSQMYLIIEGEEAAGWGWRSTPRRRGPDTCRSMPTGPSSRSIRRNGPRPAT